MSLLILLILMKKIIIYTYLYFNCINIFCQNSIEIQYDVVTNINLLYKTIGILKVDNLKSHYIVLKPSDISKEVTQKELMVNYIF